MRARIGYAEALKILGENQSKTLKLIDSLLGGAILVSAAVGGLGPLALFEARDELIKQSEKLLANFGQRVRGANGKGRTDLLVAAHAMVAVNAYFEALRDAQLPLDLAQLELTAEERLALAGVSAQRPRDLVKALIQAPLPLPTSYRPYEQTVRDMCDEYQALSKRLLDFVQGLAVWDRLGQIRQSELDNVMRIKVPTLATARYEEGFRRLSQDCLEFSIWMNLTDNAASRQMMAEIGDKLDTGLAGLQRLLEALASNRQALEWPNQLARVYRAHLERPIAEASRHEGQAGLTVPTLSDGYVNPRFRVAEYSAGVQPAEASWWEGALECDDVQRFLARHLMSPVAVEVPLVVLGQPGAGKSLLTKVLAARLPPEDYLPVRVELRYVSAVASLQDQIESALRRQTGEQMRWSDLAREADNLLPVVILDGFDELLQGTGLSRAGYLEEVRDFQQREADLGRQVAVLVTSRTSVANRMRFPEGTILANMEPFDEAQIMHWLTIWNDANATFFLNSKLLPVPDEAVLAHRGLAEQPLLLLMLCLYDADRNALQEHSAGIGRAELYEGLFTRFVDRELDKHHGDVEDALISELRNLELFRLSVVAFAMFNRGRKSVAESELEADLTQLRSADNRMEGASNQMESASDRMANQLSQAQLAISHFFFIHRSQTLVGETALEEYEFLHATFGEYLVARLVFKTLSTADDSEATPTSSSMPYDDRLWELLSFTPLSDDPQTVGFLAELFRGLDGDQVSGLRRGLVTLFRASLWPRQKGYGGYEPRRLFVSARHAAYSANLLILNVLASDGRLRASELFAAPERCVESWQSWGLLWRSQLAPAGWDGLVNALSITRWGDTNEPDLFIHRSQPKLLPWLQGEVRSRFCCL